MINAYMNDDITVKTATKDEWGTSTFDSETVRGRFEFKTKIVRDIKGEQVVSMANVMLATRSLTHNDKIVYDGKEYSIISIASVKDFSNKFLKVFLA